MRLGLSTLLVVALASASLVACGDSDTGSGGAGGGAGGETSAGGNDAGAGGDTGSGGDPGAGGGTGGSEPLTCTAEVVADAAECDEGCNQNVTNLETDATFCTISCVDDTDCGTDPQVVCAEDSDGNTACLYDCSGGNACPGSEYVCDQDALLCFPDVAGE